jgi:hypothetical protein
MNKNAKAIKDAIERRVLIAGLIAEGAVELEEIDFKLDSDAYGTHRVTRHRREVLEVRKGKLEDAQQELPDESEKLQSYVDKLLDPEAAWPDEAGWVIEYLCERARENIAEFCDPKIRKTIMPN